MATMRVVTTPGFGAKVTNRDFVEDVFVLAGRLTAGGRDSSPSMFAGETDLTKPEEY